MRDARQAATATTMRSMQVALGSGRTSDARWILTANSALDQWGARGRHGKLMNLNNK